MKKRYLFLLLSIASFKGFSQSTPAAAPAAPANDYSVSWYGFIRTDYIFDSRKSAVVREGQLNLYPKDVARSGTGQDVNAVGQFNFLSVTSRIGAKVKGPDVWGAKMSGTLEGDFFGNTEGSSTTVTNLDATKTTVNQNSTTGLFRLRHAFVNMDWKKTSLTLGQTWYPTFIPEVFPGVANFNTGILFNPFGWATQVKLKQALSNELSVSLTAYREREFSVAGSVEYASNAPTINSAMPTLNGQLQYKGKNVFLGAGVEVKSIRIKTDNGLVAGSTLGRLNDKVNSSAVFAYGKYVNDKITVKAYGITGGNMNNLVMLGGYTTSATGTYDPTKTSAFWLDIASNGKSVAPGIFFGTTKNNGSSEAGTAFVGRGLGARTVDNVWRLSGRVDFKKNKFRVSPELELTSAKWGKTDAYGKAASNFETVSNFRTMISCVYTF